MCRDPNMVYVVCMWGTIICAMGGVLMVGLKKSLCSNWIYYSHPLNIGQSTPLSTMANLFPSHPCAVSLSAGLRGTVAESANVPRRAKLGVTQISELLKGLWIGTNWTPEVSYPDWFSAWFPSGILMYINLYLACNILQQSLHIHPIQDQYSPSTNWLSWLDCFGKSSSHLVAPVGKWLIIAVMSRGSRDSTIITSRVTSPTCWLGRATKVEVSAGWQVTSDVRARQRAVINPTSTESYWSLPNSSAMHLITYSIYFLSNTTFNEHKFHLQLPGMLWPCPDHSCLVWLHLRNKNINMQINIRQIDLKCQPRINQPSLLNRLSPPKQWHTIKHAPHTAQSGFLRFVVRTPDPGTGCVGSRISGLGVPCCEAKDIHPQSQWFLKKKTWLWFSVSACSPKPCWEKWRYSANTLVDKLSLQSYHPML